MTAKDDDNAREQMISEYENLTHNQSSLTDHDLLVKIAGDYDRRMSTRWGRFLMWLLRKTT